MNASNLFRSTLISVAFAVAAQPVSILAATTAKPVASKPVATKPVATKPVATKPVATKPVATKPVTTKPAPTKPAPTKPAVAPLVVKGTPAKVATVGVAYSFKPTVTAKAGAKLKFDIANKPSWATFNYTTGLLSGTPKGADVGVAWNVVIQVNDGKNYVNVPMYSIHVKAVSMGSATLNWNAPTQTTSGAALTTLGSYKIYWGNSADNMTNSTTVSNTGLVRYVVENLAPGKYFFAMTALTRSGIESARSAVATKTIR